MEYGNFLLPLNETRLVANIFVLRLEQALKRERKITVLTEPMPDRSPDDTAFRVFRPRPNPFRSVDEQSVGEIAGTFLRKIKDRDAILIRCNISDNPRANWKDTWVIRLEIYRYGWRSLINTVHRLERS